jgi:hypothetical protein
MGTLFVCASSDEELSLFRCADSLVYACWMRDVQRAGSVPETRPSVVCRLSENAVSSSD